MPSISIAIDLDNCMGAQRCTFLAPRVFQITDEGVAEVVDASAISEKEAHRIAGECPNMAIVVQEI